MTRASVVAVSLALVVTLVGCGGNGTTVSPGENVRMLQPGDQWDYIVTGTISDGTQTEPQQVTGTARFIMTPEKVETPSHETASVMLASREVVGKDFAEATAERIFIIQDLNGTIWICGGENEGGEYWFGDEFDERYELVESPLTRDSSWHTHVQSSQGPEYDDYYIVTGTGKLNVPGGGFDTYVVTCNGLDAGSPVTATYWWAPHLGMYAQKTETRTRTDSLVSRLTYKLAGSSP